MSASRFETSHRRLVALCALLLPIGFASFVAAHSLRRQADTRPVPRPKSKNDVLEAYGRLPLVFEKNLGQTDSQVKYLAHAGGYTLFLTDREMVLRLGAPKAALPAQGKNAFRRPVGLAQDAGDAVVRLALSGSVAPARVEGVEPQAGHSNYLIGNDPSRWQKNVPLYGRVKYQAVYPGIDAVYHGNRDRLETDYIVAAGADPERITLEVKGAKLALNAQGDLVITSSAGDLILRRPNAYQQTAGTRREIRANYIERGKDLIGVQLGDYDPRQPLLVDPVVEYSTFLGGTGRQFPFAIAADSTGNAYVTGNTTASDFPTTSGAYQKVFPSGSNGDGFITKLAPDGKTLVFSTFLGGSTASSGNGIAVDPKGNIFVAGSTLASDFPVTSTTAYQVTAPNGGVFVSELDPTGSTLLYSTYLAGSTGAENAVGLAIALNPSTITYNAYVLGRTTDTNFPVTPSAFQVNNTTNQSNPDKGTNFLSRIDTSPSRAGTASLVYSTYLGGTTAEFPTSVAADSNQNAYVTGSTISSDFPITANAFMSFSQMGNQFGGGFVSRIDTTQSGTSSLIYSTYFGGKFNGFGNAFDTGGGIATQPNSIAVVVGYTYALAGDFPVTANALETASNAPNAIAFLARFDTTKSGQSSLLYSSTWGGSTSDLAFAAATDPASNIYMAGTTSDKDFPTTPGAPLTSQPGRQSAFLSKFDPTGVSVLFSTYWGSGLPSADAAQAVAADSASPANVYITGQTLDSNFPTTAGAYQTTFKGTADVFITKMSPGAVTGVFVTPGVLNFGSVAKNTTSAGKTVTLFNSTPIALSNITASIVGTNSSDFAIQSNTCPAAPATLAAGSSCTITVTFTPTTTSSEVASLAIADSDPSSPQSVALSGTGTAPLPGVTLSPSPVNFGGVSQGTNSQQGVTLLNNSSAALTITNIQIMGPSDFTQTNNCPASPGTLAAGSTCTITVTFAPTTTGNETATLQVTDSDPSSPQTDTLSGTGTAPLGSVTVAPTSINFGNVNINATSPAQTVTLTNSKTVSLTINSVTIAGSNAADFGAGSKCGSALAANSSCTISVTFTPTTRSAESATLRVSDSDSTSPQTVALSGTGVVSKPDFTISAAPPAATVSKHGTVTAMVTVTSIGGFSSAVTLSCGSLPGDSTCAFSQNPLTPGANGTASSTVTLSTSVGVIAGAMSPPAPRGPWPPAWIWVLAALGFAMFGMWRAEGRRFKRAACAFALLSIGALASCTGTPSTPTGTYAVHLTGQTSSTVHTFKFMLTVK